MIDLQTVSAINSYKSIKVSRPKIPLEFSVCEKLSLERRDWRESENPYLAKITAHFDDFKYIID